MNRTNATTRTRTGAKEDRRGQLVSAGDLIASMESRLSYRIDRLLGQGGFGQVYLARRVGRSAVVPDVTGATLRKVIAEQVDMAATTLHTDESGSYRAMASELAGHKTVNHSAGRRITSNQAENYRSQLKRCSTVPTTTSAAST